MPRRPAIIEEPPERIRWVRFTIWLVAGILLMVTTLFAWQGTEQFLF